MAYRAPDIDPTKRYALTLHAEWAWAVARLGKNIENRSWDAPALVGQWLVIHGGCGIGGRPARKGKISEFHRACVESVALMAERGAGIVLSPEELERAPADILQQGRGIVAICRLAGFQRGPAQGWYIGDPDIGWQLGSVRVLPEPIPCMGQQGLWEVGPDLVERIREQLGGRPR